jgi:hypothetical protein
MPSLGNSIHSTTIYGQIYRRGVDFYPPFYGKNFVYITTQNFQMLKQVARFNIAQNRRS